MITMTKLSIEGCEILRLKDAEITIEEKQAIKTELKTMSETIEDAMKYTKKGRLNGRDVTVRIWFNSREAEDYTLQIDTGGEDWEIEIVKLLAPDANKVVGNIVSEKWSLVKIFAETAYELPDTI